MTTHGTIGPFEQGREDWTSYTERLEQYFTANGVEDAGKQRAILLSVCGAPTYQVIRNLVAPEKPTTLSFKEIVTLVREHYCPPPSEIVQRFMFNTRSQKEGETIAEYVADLRRISEHCKFGDTLDIMLRDRVVCGIRDGRIQRRLLAESGLTFKKAFEMCQATEMAEKNAQNLRPTTHPAKPSAVMSLHTRAQKKQSTIVCYRCNSNQHAATDCRFKTAECHKCGKKGHIAKACRSKAREHLSPQGREPKQKGLRRTNQLTEEPGSQLADDESQVYGLFKVTTPKVAPIQVQLRVNEVDMTMEVDTGAALSVMSSKKYQQLWKGHGPSIQPTDIRLTTYTGEKLEVKGNIQVQVQYQGQKKTLPLLIVAGAGPTLLGRNWLQHIKLDWRALNSISVEPASHNLQSVIERYPGVFKEGLGHMQGVTAKLHVDPTATPQFCKARSVPYALRGRIEQELRRLEESNIIEKVEFADWAAPIVPVSKPDGTVRICGDYKVTVNKVAKLDTYPLPHIDDIFASLAGGQKFSKLDLAHAYQQISLEESSRNYVVINTHKGLYRYNRLPFGVASAPAIFQRAMDSLLQDIEHVTVYLDDILVTGKTEMEHLRNLEEVLSRLEKAGIRLKKSKCAFMLPSVEYLGHTISAEGLLPTKEKVRAIMDAPTPQDVSQLRSFLGLINYYGKFLPHLSSVLSPLYLLLQKQQRWIWGKAQAEAFQQAKTALTSTDVLTHYDPTRDLILECDASPYGVGAVLSHRMETGEAKPIAFASRSLTPAEKKYSQLDKEGLAIIFGVKRFHQYLAGRMFSIYSDHKPLQHIFAENRPTPAMASARLQRWALTLGAYNYTITYKPGSQHGNADLLSRLPLPDSIGEESVPGETIMLMQALQTSPISASQIKTWTARDPLLSKVKEMLLSGWTTPATVDDDFKPFQRRREELSLHDGCILWGNRVVVPPQARQHILDELHEGHPGMSRMKGIARGIVWWPNLDKEIEQRVQSCTSCQVQQKAPASAPLHPWEWPTKPWTRLHIDYAGPFLGKMFLVVVDAHSKWLEVDMVPSATSHHTINKLRAMFATHGIPEVLVSDNGTAFTSSEFQEFTKQNGIRHVTSAPYHPSSNGLAERYVQTFKNAMKKDTSTADDLQKQLSRFLFRYRSTSHTTTGVPPCQLLMGRQLRSHLDCLRPSLTTRVTQAQSSQKMYHDRSSKERNFKIEDPVFVSNFAQGPKWLPGEICKIRGPLSYEVKLNDGRVIRRHVDHIRRRTVPSPSPPDDELLMPPSSDISPPGSTSVEQPATTVRRSTRVSRPPVRYPA